MKNELKKRYNGIDIVKVLAIFFVPLLHFYLNYDFHKINMLHFHNVIEIAIRWLAFSCIGLFITSSGYLMCNKKISLGYYKKVFYFLFVYAIALGIHYMMNNKMNPNYFLNYFLQFFQFPGYFWYVPFYACLYSIIPFLNVLIDNLSRKEFKLLIFILISITGLPTFVNSIPPLEAIKILFLPGSFCCLWPGVYYFIGAYFKKYDPKISKARTLLILVVSLLFIATLNFTYSKGSTAFFTGGGYGNIISFIITFCIFNIFYDINIKNKIISKPIKFLSCLTYETYLSLIISDFYTSKIIRSLAHNNFVSFKYILIEPLLNYLFALIIGIGIHYFVKLFIKFFDLKSKKV